MSCLQLTALYAIPLQEGNAYMQSVFAGLSFIAVDLY